MSAHAPDPHLAYVGTAGEINDLLQNGLGCLIPVEPQIPSRYVRVEHHRIELKPFPKHPDWQVQCDTPARRRQPKGRQGIDA